MIRPVFVLFCCLLSFSSDLLAQAENGSVLYEISGRKLKQPSYVFGTIHLRDRRAFEQVNNKKDSLWYCFKRCETIAGELKFDKDEMKTAAKEQVMMPDGITLQSLMSKEEYEKVKAYSKEVLGWKAILIDRIKPLFTVSLLTEAMTATDYKWPLDIYLQKEGEKKKKEITGIETVDEQMQALSSMSLKEQATELVEFVKEPTQGKAQLNEMIELYRQRRLIELYELTVHSGMTDTIEAALLSNRNAVMVERIESMMHNKPVFVAIGAAHLPGDKGVLALLRERGYKVRAIDKKVISGQ